MGSAWVDHPSWELVAEASEAAGRDVARLLLEADDDELRHTRNSQLATFMVSMIALDAVTRVGIETAGHAGHSLGEYSALVAAGVVDFHDGVRLVSERGEAMQVAAEEQDGTMAAVMGLDDDLVEQACEQADGDVWVANYNAPGQVVIAGSPTMVDAAGAIAKELGAKRVIALPVGGAFHTPFMASARDRLSKAVDKTDFRMPDHPVYANVDAAAHTAAHTWIDLLSSQLTSPVRWRQSLHNMCDDGFTTFIELGPGAVLTGTVKRTAKECQPLKVNAPADIDAVLEALAGPPVAAGGPLEGEAPVRHRAIGGEPGRRSLPAHRRAVAGHKRPSRATSGACRRQRSPHPLGRRNHGILGRGRRAGHRQPAHRLAADRVRKPVR